MVYVLSCIAIVYTSLTTLRQIDLKKIVAYSSVAHMGYVTMGLFSLTSTGIAGAILIMISHGFVSSALFLCIGVVYDRYKTRIYKYYSGIAQFMPAFTIIFLIFTMANLGLPGTSSFPGEFLVILGTFEVNALASVIAVFGTILSAAYALWMFNRVSFGALKSTYISTLSDINTREFFFLFPLLLATIFFGVYPNYILNAIHLDLDTILSVGSSKDTASIMCTIEDISKISFSSCVDPYADLKTYLRSDGFLKEFFIHVRSGKMHRVISLFDTDTMVSQFQNIYFFKYKTFAEITNGGDKSLARYAICQC